MSEDDLTSHYIRAGRAASPQHGHGSHWARKVVSGLLALTCVVAGGVGGWLVHQRIAPSYTASTSVLVLPTAGGLDSSVGGSRSAAEVRIETEAELVHSAQVAEAASQAIGRALTDREILSGSSVIIPPNSQVLVVTLVAPTPELARDGSMALAAAYLARRQSEANAEIAGVVDSLTSQLTELTTRLQENSTALAAVPTDATGISQRALIESQRALLVDQISDINSRLVALRIAATPGGEVITEALLPAAPTSPVLVVNLGAGLVLGGLLGAGLLLLLNRPSQRRPAAATGERPRFPVLAALSLDPGLIAPIPVGDLEVLGRIRDKIAAHPGEGGPIAIVGVGDPVPRTRVAIGLAESWAERYGSSVLVLTEAGEDAGLLPSTGGPSDGAGLSEVLRGESSPHASTAVVQGLSARLLGVGRHAEDLSAATRGALTKIWWQLHREFGGVLVQSASPLDSTIAQSVAQSAGRIVVVVEVSMSQTRELTSTLEELDWLGVSERVAGIIIVSRRPRHALDSGALDNGALANGALDGQTDAGKRRSDAAGAVHEGR